MRSKFRPVSAYIGILLGTLLSAPLAAQDMPALEIYGELPGIEEIAISSSGSTLAIAVNQAGNRKLLVVDPQMQSRLVIGANDVKFRSFQLIGDDNILIYHSDTVELRGFSADQYELMQASLMSLNSRELEGNVFGDSRRLNNAIHGRHGIRYVDGQWRGYFGAIEYQRADRGYIFDHGRPALYEVDLSNLDEKRVANSPRQGVYRDWLLDQDGQVAATFSIDRTDGEWRIKNSQGIDIVEGQNRNGDARLVGFGSDGSTLIYSEEDNETGLTDWHEVPLTGGQSALFLDEDDIDRIYWDRLTGRYLGHLKDDAKSTAVFENPEHARKVSMILAAFSGQRARIIDWSSNFDQAVVHTQGDQDSGSWFYVDVPGRRADAIGYDRPTLTGANVGAVSIVNYAAQDGLKMDGILTLPPGREAENLPVIVLPHGGPHSQDKLGFDWWAQAYASRGYAVFQPNFRGSTGRGQTFSRAGYGEWGRKMQTDISDGLAHLVEQGIVDPERACIVGASYGGYAALAGVTIQQGLYRCAVSVAGVSDIARLYSSESRESGRSKLTRTSLLEEYGPRDGWAAVSPRRLAERADAPILLIHGRDDTVVLYEQSRIMADALDDHDKPHRLIELEDEDHWLSLPATRLQMLEESMRFVIEHNPPD